MTSIFQGPGPTSDDLVVTTVDEEIRQEALRQIESIDYDDDDWRIEPLPTFTDDESGDRESGEALGGFETAEEANRRNN
ncbi:MAG: hypothetical protein OEW83_17765 [Acidimicrobiia bacterium]|nr:hypothetical protein [Acidimicrobiia bacterium]